MSWSVVVVVMVVEVVVVIVVIMFVLEVTSKLDAVCIGDAATPYCQMISFLTL
jgi:hypothetical protein